VGMPRHGGDHGRRVNPRLASHLLLQGVAHTATANLIGDGMHDRLHEPYRWGLIQQGDGRACAALASGALGCVISGAGQV